MTLPEAAVAHYQDQQVIAATAGAAAADMWSTMGDDFEASYSLFAGELFATTIDAQRRAATNGVAYVPDVLDEQGIDATQKATLNPARFQGGTPDGRSLETLLHGAVYATMEQIGKGVSTAGALDAGGKWLQRTVLDVVRDADRQAVQGSLATTKTVTTWTRMLNPPSCRFCMILAGKVYRWNQGFQAHRSCDCRHVPTVESVAGDLTVDSYKYFHSLDRTAQDQLLGQGNAQAVRDGADIYRVVNPTISRNGARRGLASPNGWQARRWGSPTENTVDDVYRAAGGDRAKALRLLEKNGYITGDQVAGGNLIGNAPGGQYGDLAAGALGRGGTRKGAMKAYRKAVSTGVRDPLEPATQTAAERRLHTAFLRKQAVERGSNPFAVNSARQPLTPAIRALVERDYERQVAAIATATDRGQLAELARLLGIRR
jgi:hypothetical protein